MEEIESKVKGKQLLLDNPESRRLIKKKKTAKCLTNVLRSQARSELLHDSLQSISYEQLMPLNRLWESYIRGLISATQKGNLDNALIKADYHGAHLRVIQSRCPTLVNLAGIVVQETLNTLILVQPSNRAVTVPKAGCVFSCTLEQAQGRMEWHLFGDQLIQHSGFRSSKKFKSKSSVAL